MKEVRFGFAFLELEPYVKHLRSKFLLMTNKIVRFHRLLRVLLMYIHPKLLLGVFWVSFVRDVESYPI